MYFLQKPNIIHLMSSKTLQLPSHFHQCMVNWTFKTEKRSDAYLSWNNAHDPGSAAKNEGKLADVGQTCSSQPRRRGILWLHWRQHGQAAHKLEHLIPVTLRYISYRCESKVFLCHALELTFKDHYIHSFPSCIKPRKQGFHYLGKYDEDGDWNK